MKTVLIIEDHPDIRTSLQELLQWSGHKVHVAANGAEGVSMFNTHHPEVALVNIGLPPGIDGYEVARQVRAAPGGEAVYMVAVTGWAGAGIRTKALDAGFDQHVTKPFDVDGLVELVTSGKRAVASVA
jgi:CheY-like chemotaxis protein